MEKLPGSERVGCIGSTGVVRVATCGSTEDMGVMRP